MPSPPTRPSDDRTAALVVVFGFSVGLGVGTLAIPLLALSQTVYSNTHTVPAYEIGVSS